MWMAIGLGCLAVTLVAAPLLERRRRRALHARTNAESRVALLETARTLPGHDLPEATRLACEGVCMLGFDAAAVSVRRGRVMVPLYSVGLPRRARPIAAEGSFAARCLDQDRTLVVADYASLPTHLPERADLRTVVLTPVRADGRPVATLSAARRRVDEPTAQEIAIAETVAGHLGRVFATQASIGARQRLLARMQRLDDMRSIFVEQVSGELHARLRTLRVRSSSLAAEVHGATGRDRALQDIAAHTTQLRETIDTMLDFSRFQADRPEPALEPIAIADLLRPLCDGPPRDARADAIYVSVDAPMVRRGLELLLDGPFVDGWPELREEDDRIVVVLEPPAGDDDQPPEQLVVSLAERLLLAGGAALLFGGVTGVALPRWDSA